MTANENGTGSAGVPLPPGPVGEAEPPLESPHTELAAGQRDHALTLAFLIPAFDEAPNVARVVRAASEVPGVIRVQSCKPGPGIRIEP